MESLFKILALLLTLFSASAPVDDATLQNNSFQEQIAVCGDQICQFEESCSTCQEDCGICLEQVKSNIKESIVYVKYEFFGEVKPAEYTQQQASGSGVIIDQNENYLFILTNRHVIDCRYTNACWKVWHENMTIRTQDGVVHQVERVSFDPELLDIAYLRVRKANSKEYLFATTQSKISDGDGVIAAGYPASKIGGGIVEYSSKSGEIKEIKELILPNGRLLHAIESDAFTFYGSSGGGFFNSNGELIGISTWGIDLNKPSASESIAIKIDSLVNKEDFISCKDGEYIGLDGSCQTYYGINHRVVCFFTDQKTMTPLSGRVYYNDENQGKTIKGCREIVVEDMYADGLIEFDRDYAQGLVTYNLNYSYPMTKEFAISWFVE